MVEQSAVNRWVVGSSPTSGATFVGEKTESEVHRTDSAQISPIGSTEFVPAECRNVKFPKIIRHRKVEVTIYGKKKGYPFYRIAYRVNGKRRMKSFSKYGAAKAEAEVKARELNKGSQILALTAREVTAMLAIRDALENHRRDTGRTVSALQAVTQYLHVTKLLGDRPVSEAVEGYLGTVAVVRRTPLSKAVDDFVATRAAKAESKDGQRPALNPKYVENTASWLKKFAGAFPGYDVGDLNKEHLNAYMAAFSELSAKSRNDRRAILKLFLKWCVRNDYLPLTHRLLEADGLAMEVSNTEPTDYYRPDELRQLLDTAKKPMRVVIALQAFAGLRLEEVLRLNWSDVFGVPGHIELSKSKSKTRQRRLVEICPVLEKWLADYRESEGKVAAQWQTVNGYVQAFTGLREGLNIPSRRNGLRHGFVTFHFALHSDEKLAARLAGNSPTMIHAHYKGLATKVEAEKWFNVGPK
jgi:integrase